MRWWIDGMIRRLGHQGALENVRVELEAQRLSLEAAEALGRRLAPPVEQRSGLRRRRSVA